MSDFYDWKYDDTKSFLENYSDLITYLVHHAEENGFYTGDLNKYFGVEDGD